MKILSLFMSSIFLLISCSLINGPSNNFKYSLNEEILGGSYVQDDTLSDLGIYAAAGPFPISWTYEDGSVSDFRPIIIDQFERIPNNYAERFKIYQSIISQENRQSKDLLSWTISRKAPYALIYLWWNAYKGSKYPALEVEKEIFRMTISSQATYSGYVWLQRNNGENNSTKQYLALAVPKSRHLRQSIGKVSKDEFDR